MSQKDELLKGLDQKELLQLARSASENAVDENASRRDLIRLVKASLSIREMKEKVDRMQGPSPAEGGTVNELFLSGVAQMFLITWGFLGTLTPSFFPNGSGLLPPFFYQRLSVWSMAASACFLIFAGLHMGSMLKMRGRFKGNRLGVAGASVAFTASVVAVLYYTLTYLELTLGTIYLPDIGSSFGANELGVVVLTTYGLLVVMTMILMGLFFLVYRERFSNAELWMVTGLLYVLVGAFQLSYTAPYYVEFVYIASSPMFIVVGVMGMACFFTGKYVK